MQTCIIHLIRNTFRLASKKDWGALKHDVKPIYTAHLRGSALGFRNLTNYITRSLLESGGFRPYLHSRS